MRKTHMDLSLSLSLSLYLLLAKVYINRKYAVNISKAMRFNSISIHNKIEYMYFPGHTAPLDSR